MEKITFYTHPQSRGRTVHWMLEECGATYDTVVMDYEGSLQKPEYLAINPMCKVPTLRYGDTVVTEAAAIITFLADLFPEKNLIPSIGDPERGEFYRWMFFMAAPVEAAIMEKALNLTPPPGSGARLGYGDFDRVVRTLEYALSGKTYLLGDHFTALDLYMSSGLNFGYRTQVLPENPLFQDYIARMTQRDAFQRAQQQMAAM